MTCKSDCLGRIVINLVRMHAYVHSFPRNSSVFQQIDELTPANDCQHAERLRCERIRQDVDVPARRHFSDACALPFQVCRCEHAFVSIISVYAHACVSGIRLRKCHLLRAPTKVPQHMTRMLCVWRHAGSGQVHRLYEPVTHTRAYA